MYNVLWTIIQGNGEIWVKLDEIPFVPYPSLVITEITVTSPAHGWVINSVEWSQGGENV